MKEDRELGARCASSGGVFAGPIGAARRLAALLAVVFAGLFVSAPCLAADGLMVDSHAFAFVGVEYSDDGTSTWSYDVTSGRKPALSHWVLQLDPSLFGRTRVVRCSEPCQVGTDPMTGVYGLKFDGGYRDNESRRVTFTLDRWLASASTSIAAKAGKDVHIGSPIEGPGPQWVSENRAPVAVEDWAAVDENGAVEIEVLRNDTDEDGTIVGATVDVTRAPRNGAASVDSASGSITYAPNAGWCGEDELAYRVRDDDDALSNEVSVSIAVTCNVPPVAAADLATTDESTAVAIPVLANDRDGDGAIASESVTIVRAASSGLVSVHAGTGVITYTPAFGSCGDDTLEYTIRDDDGATSNPATVKVSVLCSDPPLAIDDLYNVAEGSSLDVSAAGILANDQDTPGRPLYASLVSHAAHGRVTLRADGSFSYAHDGSEAQDDAFTYTADDTVRSSNVATVRLVIAAVNDAPSAADDEATTDEDRAVDIDVRANDADPEGDTLSVDWADGALHGRVTNLGSRVQYQPEADFHGVDTFDYAISDGRGGTATAVVTVRVRPENDTPIVQDDSGSTDEDAAITLFVLANDRDPDGDELSILSVTQPASGSVTSDGRAVTYAPNADFFGVDAFTYTAADGLGGVAAANVTVAVVAANDAPEAGDGAVTTAEDAAVDIAILAMCSDADGDALSIDSVSRPEHGTAISAGGSVTYVPDRDWSGADAFAYTVSDGRGGTATGELRITVTPANDAPVALPDAAATDEGIAVTIPVLANDSDPDGDALEIVSVQAPSHGSAARAGSAVVYTPAPGFHGLDAFRYEVSDGRGGSAAADVAVSVATINSPPVARGGHVDVDEDVATTILLLTNDTDPDGDALSVESVTQPRHGTLTWAGLGATYTPTRDFVGEDAFSYTVSDGQGGAASAVVSITVLPVNDVPVAGDDAASTAEDVGVHIAILANDRDDDGDALRVASVTQPTRGTAIVEGTEVVYVPDRDVFGIDSFSYVIQDSQGATASAVVTVRVDEVNDAPVAHEDAVTTLEDVPATIAILGNDSDADGDLLRVESFSQPLHGVVTLAGGAAVYSPREDYFGDDAFSYVAADGRGGSSLASVHVTISSANDFPVAQDDSAATQENVAVAVPVLANDRDVDADALTVQAVSQPANGTVTNERTGVRYAPASGFHGTDTFTYTVADGRGGSATARVAVAVSRVNHDPVAADDAVTTRGELVTIEVLKNDSDPDGDFLLVQSVGSPANGTLVNGRTSVSYIPREGFVGVDRFSYIASDGNGGSATATVEVAVSTPNSAPLARDDHGVTNEGEEVRIAVLENDADADGDSLRIQSVTQPAAGRVTLDGSALVYRPRPGTSGLDIVAYAVTDGQGGTASASVMVVVLAVNEAPAAQDDSATTVKDAAIAVAVLTNDSDDGVGTMALASVSPAQHGTTSIDGDEIVYAPDLGFVGIDTFSYVVRDSEGKTATAAVTIGVSDAAGAGGAAANGCAGRAIISEVAWAGSAAGAGDEWIELRNLGTEPIDLTGWTLQWRRTRPASPEDAVWKTVELAGTLEPAAVAACDATEKERKLQVSPQDGEESAWAVSYPVLPGPTAGYYLVERARESTVSDVPSSVVYDDARSVLYELSDAGEVVVLLDDTGSVVDTANASNVGRDAWSAGCAATFGSMERVDPLGPDVAENWSTNLGVVTSGRDALQHPLRATPAAPNSPALGSIYGASGAAPLVVEAGSPLAVSLPLSRDVRRATGWPWIVTTRPGVDDAAGAGGETWSCSFSGRAEAESDAYRLEIGTESAASGLYVFWIVYGPGQSLLVPVLLTP